jgi:hypothetical protein
MTASAVVIPLTRISIVRLTVPSKLSTGLRISTFATWPMKGSSALFAGDNSLHCSGCRPLFRERERGTPPFALGLCDLELEIESASSRFHLLPCHKIHQSSCHKAPRIPVEICSEIFLSTVQVDPHSQTNLMLVYRHWRDIMLSTPGIHSQLRIYGWTEIEGCRELWKKMAS